MSIELYSYLKYLIQSLEIFKTIYKDHTDVFKAAEQFKYCDKILIIGTGGASLGSKCLVNFYSKYTNTDSRVVYIENIDARTFISTIQYLNPKTTGLIVISKSGMTTETLMLFLTVIQTWTDYDFQNNACVITKLSNNNDLLSIAKSMNIKVIEHNSNIGGRYSVFSIVGLLPAVLAGIDIEQFLSGANFILNKFQDYQSSLEIISNIQWLYKSFLAGKINQYVLFTYTDLLNDFGKWFIQLVSESLGKSKNFGITPIHTVGCIDQHSMLQLFLSGPLNKLYTLITQNNNIDITKVNTSISGDILKYLNNHSINDLMVAHCHTTTEVLQQIAPVRTWNFDEININTIGQMMMRSIIEVIGIAKLVNINPFDQPAVEKSKHLVLEHLLKLNS